MQESAQRSGSVCTGQDAHGNSRGSSKGRHVNGELPAARRGGARCCYPPVRVRSPYRKQRLGDLQQWASAARTRRRRRAGKWEASWSCAVMADG
ncbi:hypothetical protein SNOG_15024 [Parastagonospora nodorum SN15]|uniref:Uncharacterized protein n=1 Tax=Phaeosphaeria nodorum (strain SN15 / ATCC MYA-4574 / FGSC 10173) TaxID=321614 RepID=Q0TZK8_PHANO|nr:hypothetical protein SNOG_15024 [Parastagonospora nodorum SN15]EAT77567.1 hypothetical protein SNOG_15024 [Parastagonospora nodorum SN15]